jgi:hypothetical protein
MEYLKAYAADPERAKKLKKAPILPPNKFEIMKNMTSELGSK